MAIDREREARAAALGMTPTQLRARIRKLFNAGWSERRIAKAVGMSKTGVHWQIQALKGIPRTTSRSMCESCWDDWPLADLDGGLCPECRATPTAS
jgi:AraC-like DNA-binding protein